MMEKIKPQRAAFITGGAKRLGQSMALHLANKGWDIALHFHRSNQEAEATAEKIRATGRQCQLYQGDASSPEIMVKVLNKALGDFPALSLLINNASIFCEDSPSSVTMQSLSNQISINALTPILLMKHYQSMKKTGSIINMVDSRVDRNDHKYYSYSLSKKMLCDATKISALDYYPNIRVNAIAPGAILPPSTTQRSNIMSSSSLDKYNRTPDILNAIDYLLGSIYINGEILFIDGGKRLG